MIGQTKAIIVSAGWTGITSNIICTPFLYFLERYKAKTIGVGRLGENIGGGDAIFRRNATHCISPYAIVVCEWACVCVCLSVCLSVCVYAALVDLRKTASDRDVVFCFRLRGITSDIICKSLTQIELQIPRWRTKWRT